MQNPANNPNDKDHPYRSWVGAELWRNRLQRRATHKALDIADDEMDFNQSIQKGMGWKELAVIAATGLGAAHLLTKNSDQAPAPVPQAVVQPAVPSPLADSEYEVRFFDVNGNPIDVPHISQIRSEK